jgi:hypothetical protein
MNSEQFTPKAFFLWNAIPEAIRQAILAEVLCTRCRTAVSVSEYTGRDVGRSVIIEGKCPTCGGRVARHVEPSEPCAG